MSPLLNIGQVIKGKTKYLHHQQTIIRLRFPSTPAYQTPKSNSKAQNVIIESIRGHWRLKNEADILKHFQSKTSISSFRPLIDEIIEPADPPSIVLRYLDNDLLSESYKKTLTRSELKFVARRVLQALQVLHHDGFVHTDVKPDNILVNHGKGNERFSEVQLADFGGTVSVESKWAKEGHIVGTYKWRSPEVLLGMPWGTSSDIWSFGCSILMLIYGDHYPLNPKSGGVENAIVLAMQLVPADKMKPLPRITQREITKVDNAFLQKILKLDHQDRPTVKQFLEDEWWDVD